MAKSVHNPEKPSRFTAQKDIDKLLPVFENPKKVVMFISPSILKDPEPYNKGRQLGYFNESIPPISKMIGTDGQEFEVIYDTLDEDQLNLKKGALSFHSGENPELYKFLMRHNRRLENNIKDEQGRAPNPSKYKPIFKLYDPDAESTKIVASARKEFEIMKAIYEQTDPNVITAFARALNVKTDQDFAIIQHDVVVKVRANPDLLKLMVSPETKLKALVSEALQLGIIKQDGHQIGWVEGDEFGSICTLPIGQKIENFFPNWLANDNSNVIENMQARIGLKRKTTKK